MFFCKSLTARMLSPLAAAIGIALLVPSAPSAAQRGKKPKKPAAKAVAGSPKTPGRAGALSVARQFEEAYRKKDKKQMILGLMLPTTDAESLEKRYQWLRGYGPTDPPGGRRPPILFETSRGSFVPTKYQIASDASDGPNRWKVIAREEGSYRDEDGTYRIVRTRHILLSFTKGRWWVRDYINTANTEDYGFYVDDIADKMTHLGK